MTRQENDMETTEHLDRPATSGSAASTIKAEEYDLLILGSGAAGKLLSWTLAKKGMKVTVIERLETTAPDVWAAGECAGSPHFTHISENDFHIIAENIQGGHRVTAGRQVPFSLFTDPEFARIGLSEREAKERSVSYRLAKIRFGVVFRAQTVCETRGFMKALIESTSERILGFSAFGAEAGEIMASIQIAMIAGLPYTALRDAIFAHPTMAEGLIPLFSNVSLVPVATR
jgi:pyruvate/2-oxoglutarate dehydrogenase complex dihydrolipoamide dehydrogenase (E3) component